MEGMIRRERRRK